MSPQIIARARQLSAWFHVLLCGLCLSPPWFALAVAMGLGDQRLWAVSLEAAPYGLTAMAFAYLYGKKFGDWYLPVDGEKPTFEIVCASCVVSFFAAISTGACIGLISSVWEGMDGLSIGLFAGLAGYLYALPLILILGGLGGLALTRRLNKLAADLNQAVKPA
ncbi:hypothetical protein O5O45_00580 [Hahella aquimaris]|uniref:hypothetical protein n=1 Tax=Hahella sp. HNIBRBA332 TaxID=3015983 RepID=UPI00273A7556|nr:hypothetical protein [Hahella sp. HNIBRBA332]WLQ14430.1 hypothetical protein O5O45_00580 [Hahella sp. HNIBRBA332]